MAPVEDDAALVQRCLAGERAAWNQLVQRYQRLVFAIVRRAGMDEHTGADVFQTVFTRLVQHLPQLRQPERLQAWVVTTAKRECLAWRARSGRTVSLSGGSGEEGDDAPAFNPADEAPLAEELLGELQQQHQVRLALERLDERCRQLLTLLFADEDDAVAYDEISRRLGMAVGSIGPTRQRCLGKLRTLLA